MDIQVWSDVVCPWCYLGKHRLEKALAQLPGGATVTYRAYQLDPSPIAQPMPLKAAMATKFGDPDRVDQMLDHVTSIAAADGLPLDFNRAVAANTFDAHRLIAWAAAQNRQSDMLDALQRSYFTSGADLGDRTALAAIAGGIGLDPAAALAHLESPAGTEAVNADLREARELGITSVPTFVVDGKYAIQGAQEVTTIVSALEEIARRESVDVDQ
jgi:predicted DsbA family dithiol-disulfide isomerase